MERISYMLVMSSATCAPCKRLKTELDSYGQDQLDMRIEHLDVAEHFDIASHYSVRSVPTVLCFDDQDQMIHRHDGVSIEAVKKLISIDPD